MVFNSIDIIALILLILVFIKVIFILIRPKGWIKFSKRLFENKYVFQIVALVLAAVVLYYLLQVLTIVQIFAVIAFETLLFAIGLSGLVKKIIPVYEEQIKKKTFFKSNWLYFLLWLVLLVWVFIELFF